MKPRLIIFLSAFCILHSAFGLWDEWLTLATSRRSTATAASSPLAAVTNQAGYPPVAFYLVSSTDYTTNSGTVVMTNYGSAGNSWNFTNNVAAGFPTRQSSALNGHDTLLFDGSSDVLRCAWASNAQPASIMMVMRWNSATNTTLRIGWSSMATSPGWFYGGQSTAGVNLLAGNLNITGSVLSTNKWQVWTYRLNGSASATLTNNVAEQSSTANLTYVLAGLNLGARYDGNGNQSPIDLAALVIYTNATSTVESNAYWGLTNYFSLSQ